MKRLVLLLTAAMLFTFMSVGNVGAIVPTTTGTWKLYPAQTHSTSTVYQTQVKPPINADGSSNWPKKRGVIPVQFGLSTATATTVAPVRFESILSNTDAGDNYSFLALNYPQIGGVPLTFPQLDNLTANFAWQIGDCWGGSLRWQITVQDGTDGNGDPIYKTVHLYYGTAPEFGNADNNDPPTYPDGVHGCGGITAQSVPQGGVNMIQLGKDEQIAGTQGRFDLNQDFGGPFYGTYAQAAAALGTLPIVQLNFVVDSGWKTFPGGTHNGDERVALTSAMVNDNTWTPEPSGTVIGTYSPTCDLPDAGIKVTHTDETATGDVNEVDSIQPKDTGELFRKVDCKYIYNLDVSTLGPLSTRGGTYRVYAVIPPHTTPWPNPAVFDLR